MVRRTAPPTTKKLLDEFSWRCAVAQRVGVWGCERLYIPQALPLRRTLTGLAVRAWGHRGLTVPFFVLLFLLNPLTSDY